MNDWMTPEVLEDVWEFSVSGDVVVGGGTHGLASVIGEPMDPDAWLRGVREDRNHARARLRKAKIRLERRLKFQVAERALRELEAMNPWPDPILEVIENRADPEGAERKLKAWLDLQPVIEEVRGVYKETKDGDYGFQWSLGTREEELSRRIESDRREIELALYDISRANEVIAENRTQK